MKILKDFIFTEKLKPCALETNIIRSKLLVIKRKTAELDLITVSHLMVFDSWKLSSSKSLGYLFSGQNHLKSYKLFT